MRTAETICGKGKKTMRTFQIIYNDLSTGIVSAEHLKADSEKEALDIFNAQYEFFDYDIIAVDEMEKEGENHEHC